MYVKTDGRQPLESAGPFHPQTAPLSTPRRQACARRAACCAAAFLSAALLAFSPATFHPTDARQRASTRKKDAAAPATAAEPEETIRVDADLVSLSVRVLDAARRPVNNLRREDFRVYEDGAPQTIAFFSTEEAPLSYGLVVCYSGVERAQVEKVVEAGKLIVAGNRRGDEAFIARFMGGARAQIQWNFTADAKALDEALDALYTGETPRTLIDAVYLSTEHLAQNATAEADENGAASAAPAADSPAASSRLPLRRRALILVTDGEDRHSFYSEEQLFALLRREDVQIYVVGIVEELKRRETLAPSRKSKRARVIALLNRLATETGGRAFYPHSLGDLRLIAGEIARDLRLQYTIGYRPVSRPHANSFRALSISVADAPDGGKRTAHTRSGYTW